MPDNEFPCYPSEGTGLGQFNHQKDCSAPASGQCPYEDIDLLERKLLDVENVPLILGKTFREPGLAVGQNLLKRDVFTSEMFSDSYVNFYE